MQVVSPDLNDYRWLVSPEAAVYLRRAEEDCRSIVQLAQALRRELSAPRAHLVMELIDLRRRAAVKFADAGQMYFTRRLLEQASGERVAAWKARRFAGRERIVDLCCGLGGDLLALSERGPCLGVDRDPVATLLAEANCRARGLQNVSLQLADAEAIPLDESSAWHLDPDRRASGRRTTRVEYFQPDATAVSRLLRRCPRGAVKLAPATEPPGSWGRAQREWIGDGHECRQQVAWFGSLAEFPGQRAATLLGADSQVHRLVGQPETEVARVSQPGRYVYELHATVLAAQLAGHFAAGCNLAWFSASEAYLTGDKQIRTPLAAAFEVEEVLPLDVKRIKAALRRRNIGQLEIKHRAVQLDVRKLARRLRGVGERSATLLIAGASPRAIVVLARRCPL